MDFPHTDFQYYIGATLHVTSGTNELCTLKIEQILSHNNDYVVLQVNCEDVPGRLKYLKNSTAVIKLFDRRCANTLRRMYNVPLHRPLLEQLYREDLLEDPPFVHIPEKCKRDEVKDTDSDDETDTESIFDIEPNSKTRQKIEANAESSTDTTRREVDERSGGYETDDTEEHPGSDNNHDEHPAAEASGTIKMMRNVQIFCLEDYEREVEAYRLLKPLQGTRVPRLYSTVQLQHSPWTDIPENATPEAKEFFSIPGILMEFIKGVNLLNAFPGCLLNDGRQWAKTLQSAVDTVNQIASYPVIIHDMDPRNMIMRRTKEGGYQAVMFDFAYCTCVRVWHDTDEVWGSWKWMANEEGSIGRSIAWQLGLGFEESEEGTYRWRDYHGGLRLPPPIYPRLTWRD